jgi:phosphoserine phosphatase
VWTARSDGRPDPIHLQSCTVTRAAAFFDLDKTVIAKSSTLAFGRPFFHGGLINRRAVLKTAYAQFVFSLAGADAQQMDRLRAQLTAMVTGWDAATVHEIVRETLHEIVDPLVYAEAAESRWWRRSARCWASTGSWPRGW